MARGSFFSSLAKNESFDIGAALAAAAWDLLIAASALAWALAASALAALAT